MSNKKRFMYISNHLGPFTFTTRYEIEGGTGCSIFALLPIAALVWMFIIVAIFMHSPLYLSTAGDIFCWVTIAIFPVWLLISLIFGPTPLGRWMDKINLSGVERVGLVLLGIFLYFVIGTLVVKCCTCQFSGEVCWGDQNSITAGTCRDHTCKYRSSSNDWCHNSISTSKRYGKYTDYCDEHLCEEPNCSLKKEEGSKYCSFHTCDYDGCYNPCRYLSNYCEEHTCAVTGCYRLADQGSYCKKHKWLQ